MMRRFTVGKNYTISFNVDKNLIEEFSNFSQDFNPIHTNIDAARRFGYPKPVAHGAILLSKISYLIGMKIPGEGAIWLSQKIEWSHPVFLDDHIKIDVKVKSFAIATRILELYTTAFNQNGKEALKMLNKQTPDLIILDFKVSEMDGIEVMHKIKDEKDICKKKENTN